MLERVIIICKTGDIDTGKALCRWLRFVINQPSEIWRINANSIHNEKGKILALRNTKDVDCFIFFYDAGFPYDEHKAKGNKIGINLLRNIWKFQLQHGHPVSHAILFSHKNALDLLRENPSRHNLILSEGLHVIQYPSALNNLEARLNSTKNFNPYPYLESVGHREGHSLKNNRSILNLLRDMKSSQHFSTNKIDKIVDDLKPYYNSWDYFWWEVTTNHEIETVRQLKATDIVAGDKLLIVDDTDAWEYIFGPAVKKLGAELVFSRGLDDSLDKHLEDFDIKYVLLDMMFYGDRDKGKNILDRIKTIRPHIPVALFSVTDKHRMWEVYYSDAGIDDLIFKEEINRESNAYVNLRNSIVKNIWLSKIIEPFQARISNLEKQKDAITKSKPINESEFEIILLDLKYAALHLRSSLTIKWKNEINKKKRTGIQTIEDDHKLKQEIKKSIYFSGLTKDKSLTIVDRILGCDKLKEAKKWSEADRKLKEYCNDETNFPIGGYHYISWILRNITAHSVFKPENFEISDALIMLAMTLKWLEHFLEPSIDGALQLLSSIHTEKSFSSLLNETMDNIVTFLKLHDLESDREMRMLRIITGEIFGVHEVGNDIWTNTPQCYKKDEIHKQLIMYWPYLSAPWYLDRLPKIARNSENCSIGLLSMMRIAGKPEDEVLGLDRIKDILSVG